MFWSDTACPGYLKANTNENEWKCPFHLFGQRVEMMKLKLQKMIMNNMV